MHGLKYIEVLERRYGALENKYKTQETVIESLSKNYYELKKKHDRAAMHYWMYWFKMDEESAEDLEDKGWYLIIIPDCDHAVVAQYMGCIKSFKVVVRPFENRIIQRDLIKYWTDLPEPELFDAVEDKEEKHNPTTITQEAAIARLRELGWLQEHDKVLTETYIRIGYDAAIMERASIAEAIEQVRREHKEEK